MIDFCEFLTAGDGVWWGCGSAEPRPLVDTLIEQSDHIGSIRAFGGRSWNNQLVVGMPKAVSAASAGGYDDLNEPDQLDKIPCRYSALPRMFAEHRLPCDVGLIQVSPPDAQGMCSLGIGINYVADAIAHTRVLVAEINQQMPFTLGSGLIPLKRFAATVTTQRALPKIVSGASDVAEQRIAAYISDLIDDGDTVHVGAGPLSTAIFEALVDHEDLGFHTAVVTDGLLRLLDRGVVNGSCKEVDTGLIVAGAAAGSSELYNRIRNLPVRLLPISYTHHPELVSQLRSLVSVSFAAEVDLIGQVGAEAPHEGYIDAVGGQGDFARAASLTGKRSIVALRAKSCGRSAIKTTLHGSVTTIPSFDVDFVVTEYGVAYLRYCSIDERARRLIAIAAPEFRDLLSQERNDL